MEERYVQRLQELQGAYLTFRQDEVLLTNGNKATRDLVLHPGAVAILAVNDQSELILVRQYRYAVGEVLYEIPAGKLEKGEDPLKAAQRELSEETGFRAASWQHLNTFYTVPGFCNEKMYLYLAQDLIAEEAHPDEDEIIAYEKVPLPEALQKIQSGEIKDAKSLVGILMYVNRR